MSIEQYEDAWNEHDLNGDFIDWNHWLRKMKTLNSEQACLLNRPGFRGGQLV